MRHLRFVLAAAVFFGAPLTARAAVLVVAENAENRVAIVDANSLRVLGTVPTGSGPHEIAVSPDGRRAYVANSGGPDGPGNSITVVDLESRTVVSTIGLGGYTSPHDLRVSSAGTLLWVVCAPARTVLEVDLAWGYVAKEWKFDQEGGWMLAATPDDRKIYVANMEDGSVSVIDRTTGEVRSIPSTPGEIGIDASPDGREVWVSNVQTSRIQVLDVATDRVLAAFDSGGKAPVRVRFTPDGKRAVVSNRESKTVTVFDAASRKVVASTPVPDSTKVLTISGDGRRAFLSCPDANRIVAVDLDARATVTPLSVGKTPDGVAWARTPAPHKSSVAFTIPEPDMIPEGIAYDPKTETWFVGSTYKRKIVAVDRAGKSRDFTTEAQDGLLGLVGMKVDAKRRVLWALSADAGSDMPMRRHDPGSVGRSAVHKYDLTTGKLLKSYPLDNATAKHFLNDLAIDASGSVYISDTMTGTIYTIDAGRDALEVFADNLGLSFPNGVALSDDGRQLFVASRLELGRIDLKTRRYTPVVFPATERFGADGIYFHRNSIVAIQPGNAGRTIARYHLNRARDRVERVEPLETNHPAFSQPTTGVIDGDSFAYIANAQLQYFRRLLAADGSYPLDRLRDVVVLRLRLE